MSINAFSVQNFVENYSKDFKEDQQLGDQSLEELQDLQLEGNLPGDQYLNDQLLEPGTKNGQLYLWN